MNHQALEAVDWAGVLHVIKYSDLKSHWRAHSGDFNCISRPSSVNGNLLACYHMTRTHNDT